MQLIQLDLYSFFEYQLAQRWFLNGRYDYGKNLIINPSPNRPIHLTFGWYATEFSKIEVEAKTTDDNVQPRFYQAWLRWIFVIGAHGAHQY